MSYNPSQLHGIIPPMVTPLTEKMELDQLATSKLLKHLLHGGVHGLFVLGTTGEAPSLTDKVKLNLIRQVANEVGTQIPWLVGITDNCLENAVGWAKQAKEYGATAVVAAPPYYYPTSQAALYSFFKALAEQSPLPLFLYNIPSHTSVRLERNTIFSLLKLPNVVGYKDSTLNMMDFHWISQMKTETAPFLYFLGPEEYLLETTLLGADGGVSGGANLFPQLYVRLYESIQQQDLATARRLHQSVINVSTNVYNQGQTVINGIKFALAELGIGNGLTTLPLRNLSSEEQEKIRIFLKDFTPNVLQ
ncbi:MAG: dihydrodipicolinate synthase family protein [Bacteroidota bacterium]